MTVDVRRSLINYFWNRFTDDATLKTIMGGTVRCYWRMAKADAVFPYLVHRLPINAEPGAHPIQRATYYLDIWSDSDDGEEITNIRERLIQLLDELDFNTNDIGLAHLAFFSDDDIPTDEQGIWHFAMMWDLIFRRDSEATAIEGR